MRSRLLGGAVPTPGHAIAGNGELFPAELDAAIDAAIHRFSTTPKSRAGKR